MGRQSNSAIADPTSTLVSARSEEDEAVWRKALDALAALGHGASWRSPTYSNGFNWLVRQRGIPSQTELNSWLSQSGWSVEYTHGYLNVETYQKMLRAKVCPVARKMRRLRDIDHSAAPDFLHDVVGHLPLLFDPEYSDLLQEWGERGSRATPTDLDLESAHALGDLIGARELDTIDVGEIERLTERLEIAHSKASAKPSRYCLFETFYTWAIEFGSVAKEGGVELIGAAMLSSHGELARFVNQQVRMIPFKNNAVGRPVNYTRVQDEIFVAFSFRDYQEELRRI